ncbi:TlyA family RNA methyltransferase [Thermodesulfobacteriota bacterium]
MDILLVRKNLAASREKAREMITSGLIAVDKIPVVKPGHLTLISSNIALIKPPPPYVSRGGTKLEAALGQFSVDVRGKVFLDVGSSTGGFTDCLLKHGALRVTAVDVGYGQFHWKLRQDPRVRVIEKTNIRYMTPETLGERVDGAVIDVSFISLRLVISPVSRLLRKKGFIIALIKPQFEVGKDQVGKGGVVRDPRLHEEVLQSLGGFFHREGWRVAGTIPSPLLGPKGNREFFVHLERENEYSTDADAFAGTAPDTS